MLISTRGRYALRVLVDLSEHNDGTLTPMKDVAQRQKISLKYLEQIIPTLKKHGYIEGTLGKGGGYKLLKKPEDIIVGDILNLTEGDLAPVACLEDCESNNCGKFYECRTYPMWKNLQNIVNEYLSSFTIASLLSNNKKEE